MIRVKSQRPSGTTKALALGLLLAGLMSATMMLVASKPAHADTTFTVNTTGDGVDRNLDDGLCDTRSLAGNQCTLRAAIQEANDTPGPDIIEFGFLGDFVTTIFPTSELPAITETVTIDGYSQTGSSSNTLDKGTDAVLKIQLDGSQAGSSASGLTIEASNSIVKGLAINRFDLSGVEILGNGTKVEGSFIGTDASGTIDQGNGNDGVFVNGDSNTVGGTLRFQRNLISGNADGVDLNFGSEGNKVQGNLIGTAKDGISDLGNDFLGVAVRGADRNFIGDFSTSDANTIAFNGEVGVFVQGFGTGNRILSNSIFSNGGLGIDLRGGTENAQGATANDPRDPDQGPNDLQNKPVITSAVTSGGTTAIQARLNSTPNKTFLIEFFSNPSGGEGQKFIDEDTVRTDSNGDVTFTVTPSQAVSVGQTVMATALDVTGGNSSEFSDAVAVVDESSPPSNTAPVATDDAHKAKQGKTLNVPAPGVLKNDSDPDSDRLTAQPVSDPTKGTLEADGSFSYTPNVAKGTDTFSYRVSDGKGGADTAKVTINIKKARR